MATVNKNGRILYRISTSTYNNIARHDERRDKERVFDASSNKYYDVMIHDISDVCVSFFAPSSFAPTSAKLIVFLDDTVNDKDFSVKVECSIIRNNKKMVWNSTVVRQLAKTFGFSLFWF